MRLELRSTSSMSSTRGFLMCPPLEDTQRIRWRRDSARYVQWCRREEERPSLLLLACHCELLQIPDLSNGRTPECKLVLVNPDVAERPLLRQKSMLCLDLCSGVIQTSHDMESPATAAKWWFHNHSAVLTLPSTPVHSISPRPPAILAFRSS